MGWAWCYRSEPCDVMRADVRMSRLLVTALVMIGQHITDDLPGHRRFRCTRVSVPGDNDEGLLQRPAACPRPGRSMEREGSSERFPALARQERPRDHQVTGGVTDPRASPVITAVSRPLATHILPPGTGGGAARVFRCVD